MIEKNFIIKVDSQRCPQDHTCPLIRMCPVGAISQKGYGLPSVDNSKCIKCLKCIQLCPHKAFMKE